MDLSLLGFLFSMVLLSSCNKDNNVLSTPTTQAVPDVYKKIYGASDMYVEGNYVVIKSNGLPDHKSVYYPTGNSLYEDFSGTTFDGYTFSKNPNTISSQLYTFKIPLNPLQSSAHSPTPLGPIGISLNGVPLFNQYAGPNQLLTKEVKSFDRSWGHPQQTGQ